MRWGVVLLGLPLSIAVAPGPAIAQDGSESGLASRCTTGLDPLSAQLCQDVVAGLEALQPEAGMLLAGGNPVLGTASPIGTRFRFIPRLNVGVRINLVFADVPDVIEYAGSTGGQVETLGFAVPMPELDVSVGVFDGFALAPTVGGLGSVELLGSLSGLILPGGEGFQNDVTGFGVGARVGLLRESFTAPGLSVSLMRKWIDRVSLGDVDGGDDAQFGTDLRVWSFRAAISKSFLVFGVAAGLGRDSYDSEVDFAITLPSGARQDIVPEDDPAELDNTRWSAFVDVSYILLFFNFVAELGWQESETVISNAGEIESGNLFGSIGIRLSL